MSKTYTPSEFLGLPLEAVTILKDTLPYNAVFISILLLSAWALDWAVSASPWDYSSQLDGRKLLSYGLFHLLKL